jgi:HEAT repeat protein
LDAENKTVAEQKDLSEEYVNYYGDVIAAVATLNDPRSLSALSGAITTGNMVWSTLIGFGPSAVAPVAGLLVSPEDRVRSTATLTLPEMLVRSVEIATDAQSRRTIKAALADASMDRSYLVRMRAVVGLARLGDDDALAMVKELAANDPFRDEMREGRYIVREAAAEALETQVPRRQTR